MLSDVCDIAEPLGVYLKFLANIFTRQLADFR